MPPTEIFGGEPAHGWCYYYQKISLARQKGDWQEVEKLYEQANALKLNTDDKSEVFPFLEALVNLGKLDDARSLYREEIKGQNEMRLPLCTFLAKDPGYPPDFGYDYQNIYEILCK